MEDSEHRKRPKLEHETNQRTILRLAKELRRCASTGDLDGAQRCLEEIVSTGSYTQINMVDMAFMAIINEHRDILEMCLRHKSNIGLRERDIQTIFQQAVRSGNVSVVQAVIDIGHADVNQFLGDICAIDRAALHGKLEVLKFLFQRGAKMNVPWPHPLPFPSRSRLISNPLLHACKGSGAAQLAIVKFLVEEVNADVNAGANGVGTPLYAACKQQPRGSYSNSDIVRYLVSRKEVDINSRTNDGTTAFHVACRSKNIDAALILLRNGVVTNTARTLSHRDFQRPLPDDPDYDITPLQSIRRNDLVQVLECMVELNKVTGSEIMNFYDHRTSDEIMHRTYLRDCYGKPFDGLEMSALCNACKQHTSPLIIQFILNHYNRVNINEINFEGETPLMLSCGLHYRNSAEHERERSSRPDRFRERIERQARLVRWLLFELEVNVKTTNKKGKTAEMVAESERSLRTPSGALMRTFEERKEHIQDRWNLVSWLVGRQHFDHH